MLHQPVQARLNPDACLRTSGLAIAGGSTIHNANTVQRPVYPIWAQADACASCKQSNCKLILGRHIFF